MRNLLERLNDIFEFAILRPSGKEWIIELNGIFYTIPTLNVGNIFSAANSDAQAKKNIMDSMTEFNLVDTNDETFDELVNKFKCNGFGYENKKAYNTKTNKACYIPENAEDLGDVESWLSMYVEAIKFLLDKTTLINILEQEVENDIIEEIEAKETLKYGLIDSYYKQHTDANITDHAKSFIDSFWEQSEKWQSFSTYLDSYFI